MRKYRATIDNGRDYFEVEFYSEYRANSRQNIDDLKKELKVRYGYKRAESLKIMQVNKIDI